MASCWTIYDHPADRPDQFVARKFVGGIATGDSYSHRDLNTLRSVLGKAGMKCRNRGASDDPCVVETWAVPDTS